MSDFDGSLSGVFSNMFGDSEANRAILATVFVTIVIFSYTGSDLILNQREVVQYAQTEKEWVISFENSIVDDDEDNMTFTFNDIWAHQDEKVIDFFLDDVQVSEGFAIGFIDVKIIPEECNGAAESEGRCENGIWISDGGEWECDSISATLMGDNSTLTGQWYDSGNSLSKSDSGCEPLYLRIVIYPEYDEHNEVNQSAVNEYQALSPWKVGGWGQGVVSVQINVDVNSYGGFGPLDDSEELTIEVRVHEFRATATLNNMSL